ncbi:MAG: carboxypeptidase-like regulatory domain-containing protein [Acidobacteriota bacterium]
MSRFRGLTALLFFALQCAIPARAESLKLLISVEQQNIVVPNPVRATLHFHNSGQQTIWLYKPIRRAQATDESNSFQLGIGERGAGETSGGSTMAVRLVSMNPLASSKKGVAGRGFVIVPDGLPHPRLVRLAPGNDYDERVSFHVEPGQTKTAGARQSVWGRYSFSVTYTADYSNREILARDINANLWHGQVSSNAVTLNLQPSTAQGSIAGTVVNSTERPYNGVLVTLSDNNERALNQTYTDMDGRFSFADLALGHYWITVRDPDSSRDTSVFRLIDLNQVSSPATVRIMILPVEADKADRVLHKPVLFHIVDSQGHPLAKVRLAILLTVGNVIENVKAETKADGFAAVSLIPGLNLVTFRLHGCKSEQRQANVSYGAGLDGFKFTYECSRK